MAAPDGPPNTHRSSGDEADASTVSLPEGSRSPTPTFEEMVAAEGFGGVPATDDPPELAAVHGLTLTKSSADEETIQGAEGAHMEESRPATPELSELLAEPLEIGPRGPLPPLPPLPGQGLGSAGAGDIDRDDGLVAHPPARDGAPISAQPSHAGRASSAPSSGGYATLAEAMTAVLQQQLTQVQEAMSKAADVDGDGIPDQTLLLSLGQSLSYDCKP